MLNELPALHCVSPVPGKLFRLVHGIEQASNTVSCSRALDPWSVMVRCVLSGSFSFAEANRIFFCRHCSYYLLLNSAVWSGSLHAHTVHLRTLCSFPISLMLLSRDFPLNISGSMFE